MKEKDRLNLLYFAILILMLATAAVGAYSVYGHLETMKMRDLRTSP